MKTLILLLALIYNLFASNQIENNTIQQETNFTNIEKKYISSNTVTLGMTADYYPFSFKEDGKIRGFSYDYINLIIKKSGLKIKIEMDSWSNTLNKFKTKQIDLIDVISYKKSRESFTNFSKPYFEIPNVIFARKGEINNYTGFASLKGKKVGITKDIYYYNSIKDMQLFELVEFKSSRDKMKALAYEKVDAIFNNLISGQKYIKRGGYSNIKVLDELDSKIVKREDLRLGVKKEDKVLLSIINKSMESITREEKEQIYNKWFTAKIQSQVSNSNIQLTNDEKQWLQQNNVVKIWVGIAPPFQTYENGKFDGISIEYIKRILKKYNIRYKFIPSSTFPWKEALTHIRDKKEIDLLLTAMITPDRQKDMLFTDNYISSPWVIFTRNNSNFISGIEDLKGKKVSVPNGFVMQKLLQTNYPQINLKIIKGANSTQGAIKALAVGDVDAYIGNLTIGSYVSKSLSLDNIKVASPTPFGNHDNAMAIRDDWKPLVSIINKELKAISAQGKNKIYSKYLSMKYEYGISLQDVMEWIGIISFIFLIIVIFISISNRRLNKEIKKRKRSEQILKVTNEKLNGLYKLSHLGIALSDMDGNYIEFNYAFEEICGYTKKELQSLDYSLLIPNKIEEQEQIEILKDKGFYGPYEKEYIKKDGTHIFISLNSMVIASEHENHCIWSIVEDITKLKESQAIIENKAYIDGLTQVYNRNKFDELFELEIKNTKRYKTPFSVAFIDIDMFKNFNDTYGHLIGDEVLIQMAQTVQSNIRETDIFARWGGEEFVILFKNTEINDAKIVSEHIKVKIENNKHETAGKITASFGLTQYLENDTIDTVFKRCDDALYVAKKNGRNRVYVL